MKITGVGVALVAVMALAGCGGGGLKDEDPQGYKACTMLDDAGDDVGIDQAVGIGEHAHKAKTDGIRNSTSTGLDDAMRTAEADLNLDQHGPAFYLADQKKLTAACADAGFEFRD